MIYSLKIWFLIVLSGVYLESHAQKINLISGADWKKQMKVELVGDLCRPNSYFSKCYNFGDSKCQSVVNSYYGLCEIQQKIPKQVRVYDQGIEIGKKIGKCVGQKISARHTRAISSTCNDRGLWR